MEKLNIICVDDQREVLATLGKDLEVLEDLCEITFCESAEEAMEVMEELDAEGKAAALIICDHIMPGLSGVEFLTGIQEDGRFDNTRKLLLTGQATHQDTIKAINRAKVDFYTEKPWESAELLKEVKVLLTRFIISAGLDYQPFTEIVDQETLFKEIKKNKL